MGEEQIAENLKQNIPQTPEPTLAPVAPVDTTSGQAKMAVDYGIDEMTLYKLKDYFGEKRPDMEQLQYVYTEIAKQTGSDYLMVMDHIRYLEDTMNIRHNESRIFKLYQFMKLDTIRRQTEKEMSYLRG